ncbi:MAG: hypothetical protein PHU21_02405 [Elusimicrobia bacterium]|nr:hypothetical protein [Elusimicrobiota bacterium]
MVIWIGMVAFRSLVGLGTACAVLLASPVQAATVARVAAGPAGVRGVPAAVVSAPGLSSDRLSLVSLTPSSLAGSFLAAPVPIPAPGLSALPAPAAPAPAPPSAVLGLALSQPGEPLAVNGVAVPTAQAVADLPAAAAKESGDRVMDAVLSQASPAAAASTAPEPSAETLPRPRLARRLAVYASRIWHLHYPWRDWGHVSGDMASDDKVKATNGEHPVESLRAVLDRTGWKPENPAGFSVSFTAALMEIARKLWGEGWIKRWREAFSWRTGRGSPRMEMLLTGFHFMYGLLPWGPAADALVRWNVGYHETLMREYWGPPAPGQMRIFRPPEVGFSPELVPALVKAGVQVVVVDSHHISRSLQGYDASGMPNVSPPNPADQRNRSPYPVDYQTTGKDGRLTKDALPYSYLPHWLRYTDPADGKQYKLIVFPMTGGPSYIAGYQDFPTELVDNAAKSGLDGRPLAMALDTDGDNAWGGGYSSYMESTPRLAQWLDSNGHHFGTIQEYLARYPVPEDDVLDWVEPGAWPNADWGSPQLHRWLWPPIAPGPQGRPVFTPSAWNFKLQFHALLTMAVHYLLQGEAALKARDPGWKTDMGRIVKADAGAARNPWEAAVQAVLRAFDSGHVYYGPETDLVQWPLRAAKAAVDAVLPLLAGRSFAAPTIWGPSRFPWNPGGENRGELYGWQSRQYGPEFDVFGFAFSAAGLKRVELKWRVSKDGRTAPRAEDLVYGEAAGWQSTAMELRDPYGQVEWKGLPQSERVAQLPQLAHARVAAGEDVLVDYYIEAEGQDGRVQRSPIAHVWVGRPAGR